MNKKAQIFSLDFLFSVAVMLLVIGFVFMFMDLNSASQKDEIAWLELKSIGDRASSLLAASPEINCMLDGDTGEIMALTNCVDRTSINQANLGIPSSGYGWFVKIGNSGSWGLALPSDKDYYSTKRFVVSNTGPNVQKVNLSLKTGEEATIYVWRIS